MVRGSSHHYTVGVVKCGQTSGDVSYKRPHRKLKLTEAIVHMYFWKTTKTLIHQESEGLKACMRTNSPPAQTILQCVCSQKFIYSYLPAMILIQTSYLAQKTKYHTNKDTENSDGSSKA